MKIPQNKFIQPFRSSGLMVVLLIVFIFHLLPSSMSAQTADELKKEIDKIIYFDADFEVDEIPGVVIGIAIDDSTYFYNYCFDDSKRDSLDENSVFEIGDITKAFTSLICYEAAAKGKLSIEQEVIFSENDNLKKGLQSNIEELLSHRSGLPLRPDGFGEKEIDLNNAYANYSRDFLTNYLKNLNRNNLGKKKFLYSHVGYAALELYLEQILGQSYQELITNINNQLGLTSTFFESDENKIPVQGYNRIGNNVPAASYPTFGASKGLKSTARDLLKLAQVSWNNPPNWYKASFNNSWKMLDQKDSRVSTGWFWLSPKNFQRIILQAGSTAGHRAAISFVPETKTAVVVLTTSKLSHRGLDHFILRMLNFEWKHPDGLLKK